MSALPLTYRVTLDKPLPFPWAEFLTLKSVHQTRPVLWSVIALVIVLEHFLVMCPYMLFEWRES